MEEVQRIRTVCRSCHGGCGVIAHVKDGKVVKVEGDPESPISYGTLCTKGLSITQVAYHPDRILYPMKKTSHGWERISWDEALDTCAERFQAVIDQYGPEAIVVGQGTGRDYESHFSRFGNLLGTPNIITAGHMCYLSRIGASLITCGSLPACDYEGDPACIIMWACNPLWTNPDEYKGTRFWRAYEQGAKLICIDPRKSFYAGKADLWLQVRPGTDAALVMGFFSVIIEEELYDKEFVAQYINGWDAFVERVRNEYPLDRVAEITWVDQELIRAAARMYATTKPAGIHWGVPTEQTLNCTDFTRGAIGLMAATGNLDRPGGNVLHVRPPVRNLSDFSAHTELPPEQRKKRLGGEQYKLAARMTINTPKPVWDAILTGKPYPVRAGYLVGTNPLLTRANAREVYQALSSLDFLGAGLLSHADRGTGHIFLPAGTWLEQDHVADNWKFHGYVLARQKVVESGSAGRTTRSLWNWASAWGSSGGIPWRMPWTGCWSLVA